MATIYKLGDLGKKFQVKVTDCVSGDVVDTSNITSQQIIFRKPDGVIIEKTAVLVTDPQNPLEFFIQYENTSPELSILDLKGSWEYLAEITLTSSDSAQTSQSKVFWVQ